MNSYNSLVPIVMFGLIPAIIFVFAIVRSSRAVVIGFLGAWLFLPQAGYDIPGVPPYTKMTATCVGIAAAVLVFDVGQLRALRFHLIDLLMMAWCVSPLFSSVTNGLGAYDGLAGVLSFVIIWGLPYLIGRMYFDNFGATDVLAKSLFIAGLIYVPLCLFEIRMSPVLHSLLYGGHNRWQNTVRYGGYRPAVFMHSGLELGLWMTAVTLVGIWLWYSGAVKTMWRIPMSVLVLVLTVTTILCKSTGALAELLMGLGALTSSAVLKMRWPVVCLALAPAMYCAVRSTGLWNGESLVQAAEMINEERAGSLGFRLENENILAAKARQRIVFGWGSWGRNRVYDDRGNDVSVTDGLWIIVFGQNGLFGLLALGTLLLAPPLLIFSKIGSGANLARPEFAAPAALAVVVVLYAIDCLFNAMVNPVYLLCAGALVGTAQNWGKGRSKRVRVQPTRQSPSLRSTLNQGL